MTRSIVMEKVVDSRPERVWTASPTRRPWPNG